MVDILKAITDELPKVINDASFEGANIVLYTDNAEFFKTGEQYHALLYKVHLGFLQYCL